MMPVLSLPSLTGNRNNIDIFLYNRRALFAALTPDPALRGTVRHRIRGSVPDSNKRGRTSRNITAGHMVAGT